MPCDAYDEASGYCKYFLNEKCPVMQSVRDMFGRMKACKPVREKYNIKED